MRTFIFSHHLMSRHDMNLFGWLILVEPHECFITMKPKLTSMIWHSSTIMQRMNVDVIWRISVNFFFRFASLRFNMFTSSVWLADIHLNTFVFTEKSPLLYLARRGHPKFLLRQTRTADAAQTNAFSLCTRRMLALYACAFGRAYALLPECSLPVTKYLCIGLNNNRQAHVNLQNFSSYYLNLFVLLPASYHPCSHA